MTVDPLYARKQRLNREYGLTWEGYLGLLAKQDGVLSAHVNSYPPARRHM